MKYETIIIDRRELETLKQLFSSSHNKYDKTYRLSFEKLVNELKDAKIMDNTELPEDIIRFNSIVTIKTAFNEQRTYQIVTPEKSDLANNKISVLAPMGLALFGYAQNDTIDWQFPTGINTIEIIKVKNSKTL
ncbi:GreA/GreB family elongation factor [Flavobacterium sp.]|uniref:GreA/GreB family elongation factor n=1 Tax=Flavobacterium sp. TaxID=239 RepID=UPI00404865A5